MDGVMISAERIEELAEKEIVRYVYDVMNRFQRDYIAESDHFDPRMQAVVERTIREIIYKRYQPMIDEAISKISPVKYVELMVDQLRYMGIIKGNESED